MRLCQITPPLLKIAISRQLAALLGSPLSSITPLGNKGPTTRS
jgi:hypothetical protein